ncbi:MAG: lytic transglycosylase domain-containing protein [Deltaproteobacteria bacterium]|nr:lytic transglycosylase domain-containing protein [Deltaproteobacteria bacterium]
MKSLVYRVRLAAALVIATAVIVLSGLAVSQAEIYGYQDKEGRWHFPDIKAQGEITRKMDRVRVDKDYYLASYMPLIHSASTKYGVDEALIKAIVMAESRYDRTAISRKGAVGLMQLMPETAGRFNVSNPFSPKDNIEGGVHYLKTLLTRFHNDIVLAVAAYNAGPGRVEACGGIPPIPETKQFVRRVLYYYYQFKYAQN